MPQGLTPPRPGVCDVAGDHKHWGRWVAVTCSADSPEAWLGHWRSQSQVAPSGRLSKSLCFNRARLHLNEAAPFQQPHSKEAGEQKGSCSGRIENYFIKTFEKVQKESRISVKPMFNPPPPSPPNLRPLWTGKISSPPLPAHSRVISVTYYSFTRTEVRKQPLYWAASVCRHPRSFVHMPSFGAQISPVAYRSKLSAPRSDCLRLNLSLLLISCVILGKLFNSSEPCLTHF